MVSCLCAYEFGILHVYMLGAGVGCDCERMERGIMCIG